MKVVLENWSLISLHYNNDEVVFLCSQAKTDKDVGKQTTERFVLDYNTYNFRVNRTYMFPHVIEEYTLPNVGRFKKIYYSFIKKTYCYLILRTYSLYVY